jgi:predicted hydrocarbon binding protein
MDMKHANGENKERFQIRSARDALALLSRKAYERFGCEALPLIEEVWYQLGRSVGGGMRKELALPDLVTAANVFVEGANRRKNPVRTIELSEEKFHLEAYHCNLGLEGAGGELCQAVMAMDRGLFEAAIGRSIEVEIVRSIATGHDRCEIIYRVKGGGSGEESPKQSGTCKNEVPPERGDD